MKRKTAVVERCTAAASLESRVEQLHMPEWKDDVRLSLYRAIMVSWEGDGSPDDGGALEEARTKLRRYELMERTSLLELAVWKTACLNYPDPKPLRSLLDIQDWIKEGWKASKGNMRAAQDIPIIVKLVLPYLDPEDY